MTADQSSFSLSTSVPMSPWDDPRWFRQAAADVTAMLLRLYGAHQLDVVEDAVQDAFIAAVRTWPHTGVPDNATGWLVHVARNRLRDAHRRVQHVRSLAETISGERADDASRSPSDRDSDFLSPLADDQLQLLFACCHPALSAESRVALTLKTVAQLSIDEIARALHADPRAVAQRIVRAKKTLREARAEWRMPDAADLPTRLGDVLSVCYAMFAEGHSATDGDVIVRDDLCIEAIRLLECLVQFPDTATPEAHALLALCCFVAARVPARIAPVADAEFGTWISLANQDRSKWNQALIARGFRAFDRAASGAALSRYHVEAEIAAMHSRAPSYNATPWPAIIAAYDRLLIIAPSRAVELTRAIAIAESGDIEHAWAELDRLGLDAKVYDWPNWLAARAELAERRGAWRVAQESYDRALSLTLPEPVRHYLQTRRNALKHSS